MNHSDEFLERIRQTEENNLDYFSGFLARMSVYPGMTIRTTAEYAGSRRVKKDIAEKIFKTNNYFQYVIWIFAFCLILIIFSVSSSQVNPGIIIFIIACLALGVAIVALLNKYYHHEDLSYTIRLDYKGISIDDTLYEWKNIYQTAILTERKRKSETSYLIIAFNDMENYDKFQLTHFFNLNFWEGSSTVCKYIEYFKPLRV